MSAMGHLQTLRSAPSKSALRSKADIPQHGFQVRSVPIADTRGDARKAISNVACGSRSPGNLHDYRLACPQRKKLGQTESDFGSVSTESGFGWVSSDGSAETDGFLVPGGLALPM